MLRARNGRAAAEPEVRHLSPAGDAADCSVPDAERASTRLRLLSIVEALTVTGPLKPLLMFSPLARSGVSGHQPISHRLLTTRRTRAACFADTDELKVAAAAVGLDCRMIPERRVFDAAVLNHMAEQIRDFRPDVIETHDCKSHFLQYMLRWRHGDIRRAKWVAFHHGYTRVSWRVAAYQQLDRLTLRQADHVVTVCKPFAETLSARGVNNRRISVISNSLAVPRRPVSIEVRDLRARFGIEPDELVVLSVGRLSNEKAHSRLIDALSAALQVRPHIRLRLVLVGDGPERGPAQRLATELGVDSGVTFMGKQDHVARLIPQMHLLLLPSEMESFGLQFGHGLGPALHERPVISRLNSLQYPLEIKAVMLFALEHY